MTDTSIIISSFVLLWAIIVHSVFKFIEQFGEDKDTKRKVALFTLYLTAVVTGLLIVFVSRINNLLEPQAFVGLLTLGLAGLGFKSIPEKK